MTRALILMRHAKSSWDDPLLDDHDRPLNKRGRKSAQALGDWLRAQEYLPDQTLCSSSTRTRETLSGLALDTDTHFTEALYHAGAQTLLNQLQTATGAYVLMIAHNPGIADFAERIVQAPPDHARFYDYPTGATLVARFDIDNWAEATWHSAIAEDFIIPRALLS